MESDQQDFSFKGFFTPFTTLKALHFIVIIGLIVFCNGLFNNFVGDDQQQITNNPIIQTLQNLPLFFSGSTFFYGGSLAGFSYRPLLSTSFALTYAVFGPNAFAFHL